MRTYRELVRRETFLERYKYLRLGRVVGVETFGFDRWLNQKLYRSPEWKTVRRDVIVRDMGRDLACEGYDLYDRVTVHHMNPITKDDLVYRTDLVLNPEYLITVSDATHNAIHYGDESLLPVEPIERRPNDTCPWLA